jgi:dynein heavy chain, axonemal
VLRLVRRQVPFDIFDRRYKDSWNAVMVRFRKSVDEIENMTSQFIRQSFQKLRSAEGAFELVQNFRNIQSRESINRQINERYKDILYQYMKELEHYVTLFTMNKDSPPLYKNHPPVAGAIAWARDLYLRAKKPILRFQAHEHLLSSDYGQESKQRYLAFARSVDTYTSGLYKEWEGRVQTTAMEKLKQPILMSLREANADDAAYRRGGDANRQPSAGTNSRMPPPPYRANFAPELTMIIRESKYLDRLGYQVPEAALNVTLQEDKFHRYVQDINLMLKYYENLMSRMSAVETQLLKKQIAGLQKVLKAGFTPLNWNSQRIPR